MLDELNSRLRNLDGGRRPSAWHHHGSSGSLDSGHGSMSYDPSHSHSISSGHSVYQQSSPPGMPVQGYRNMSISVGSVPDAITYQTSSLNYPFQPDQQQSQSQYPTIEQDQQQSQSQYPAIQQDQQQHQQQPGVMPSPFVSVPPQYPLFPSPAFDFNEAPPVPQPAPFASSHGNSHAYPHNRPSHHPTQQFAGWSGYGRPGGAPDTLDEENAVPPHSNPWT